MNKDCQFDSGEAIITFDSVGSGLMVAKKQLLDPAVKVDEPLKHSCDRRRRQDLEMGGR